MKARIEALVLFAAAAASMPPAQGAEGKKLVVGDVPQHTVGAYRPFSIPGEIAVSDGFTELRKGREITVWCPERVASEQPKKLAAAKRFVESPFLPVRSVSVGYVGGQSGEAVLKGLGVEYEAFGPANIWNISGKQVAVIGPGTAETFVGKQAETLKKLLKERTLVVLPGADLSLLPFGLTRKEISMPAEGAATVPALPLFAGTERDFAAFAALDKGAKRTVMDRGPAWMMASSPACIAHVKAHDRSIVIFNVAPGDAPERARAALTRVWCTVFANMNIETGSRM